MLSFLTSGAYWDDGDFAIDNEHHEMVLQEFVVFLLESGVEKLLREEFQELPEISGKINPLTYNYKGGFIFPFWIHRCTPLVWAFSS